MKKSEDMSGVFASLGKIQADIAGKRDHNRMRMAEHMPDCLRLIDGLKAAGMFGRVIRFEVVGG